MANAWDKYVACCGWSDDKIDRFNGLWAKIKDPKSTFHWSECFPPPRSFPDAIQMAAKSTFRGMFGEVQRETVISKVTRVHRCMMEHLAQGEDLQTALQAILDGNADQWSLANSTLTEEQVFLVIMILERVTYGLESPLRAWSSPAFVTWLSMNRSRPALAYGQNRPRGVLTRRFA
jgi:hypothetical protein